ncbi:MAG TPA: L,D-transpeptidase/peptidoglycan binding protein [Actinomycetota bacterium]|nr:L,D-transpeptidase/peptidoglycan binding protein [Actinomycetota bacterium]
MARGRHTRRRRGRILLSLTVALSLLGGGAAVAAYRYDQATVGRVMPGVSVEGVDLSEMTRPQALSALSEVADRELDRVIEVQAAGKTWEVTPAELGGTADVEAKVDAALALSDGFSWPSRVFRRMLDRPLEREADLSYSFDQAQVERFVDVIAKQVKVSPRDPEIAIGEDGDLVLAKAKRGRRLQVKAAREAIASALEDGTSSVELPMRKVAPKEKELGQTIVVRISENKLYLYRGLELRKTYRVATGAPGYPTPKGTWTIWHKAKNPTWTNPAPDGWGANMPKTIPGGPNNPLGTRALYLDAPGIRIHGTSNVGSIGTYASHGCIRMTMPEVEELYEMIEIGTKVLIID